MSFLNRFSVRTKFFIVIAVATFSISTIGVLYFMLSQANYKDISQYRRVIALRSSFSDFNAMVAQLPNIADNDFKFYKYGENQLVKDLQDLEDSIASNITSVSKHPVITRNKLLFRVNNIYSKFDNYGSQVFHIIELLKQRGNVNSGLVRENISRSRELYKFGQKLVASPKTAADYIRFLHYQKLYYVSNNKEFREELTWYLNNIAYSSTQSKDNEIRKLLNSNEQKSLDALVESSIEGLTRLTHLEEELSPSQKSGAWQTIELLFKEIQQEFSTLMQEYEFIIQKRQTDRQRTFYIVFVAIVLLNLTLAFLFSYELKLTYHFTVRMLERILKIEPSNGQRSKLLNKELKVMSDITEQIIRDRKFNFESLERIIEGKPLDDSLNKLSEYGVNTMLRLQNHLEEVISESERRKREEKISSWQIKGQAVIESIFRMHQVHINDLSQKLVKTLVDFLEVNQGALFLFDEAEEILILFAAYSLGKFRAVSQRFQLGDGLVGSCALERKAVYVTEVPENYFSIHSGLGEAKPKCIYLMPLAVDDRLYGVLELASFKLFEPHELDLLEMLSVNIGSGFARIKTSYESELLAEKTQRRSEEMVKREKDLGDKLNEKEKKIDSLYKEIAKIEEEKTLIASRLNKSKSNEELMHMEVLKYQEMIKQMREKGEGR